MNSAKKIILPGVFTALLIGGQLALSGISGIEIVTVLLLTFVYKYGIGQGLLVANSFSLLRCFIFGFMPNVLILYLVYYNVFVLIFGFIGQIFKHQYSVKKHIIVVLVAVIMTALFTITDNLLTPLIYGFTQKAMQAYFVASLYTMIPQIICTFATVVALFPILLKALK
ncbi:MAG: hypothetical protein IJA88_06535 [Clostridia bacterium]|nr:hypothetical protein [Clostridia bacterium]